MAGIFDLLQAFPKVRSSQKQFADDRIDKLNRSTTVIILLTAAVFIVSRSFGSTIECLPEGVTTTPVTDEYVKAMCYAQGAFKLNDFFGSAIRDRTASTFSFSYPWMALIAATLAFLFYAPYLAWKCFVRTNAYHHVPIDISGLVHELNQTSALGKKSTEFADRMRALAAYMDRSFALSNFHDGYLDEYDEFGAVTKNNCEQPKTYRNRINHRRFRCFYIPLVLKYLFVKFLYLAISIGVFPLMDMLFGFHSLTFIEFGYEISARLCNLGAHATNQSYTDYVTSQYFPRHVLCKLKIRADASEIHEYSFQCGLPANVFNEIVFLVIWYWLVLLVVLNVYSLLKWVCLLLWRRSLVYDILTWPFRYNYHMDKHVDSFVYDYLSSEGFLVIMLIRSNTQDWYCRILMRILWTFFMERVYGEQHLHETESDCATKMMPNTSVDNQENLNEINIKAPHLSVHLPPPTPLSKECKNNFKSPEQQVAPLKRGGDMV